LRAFWNTSTTMPLTCYCDYDEYSWYYEYPDDYTEMPTRKKRARCSSCNTFLNPGEVVTQFNCSRPPKSDIEYDIYDGHNVPLADKWLCETCSDLWFSLHELGFECVAPDENIKNLVKEYVKIFGKK